ncbi:MAG: hypothetical protein J0M20_05155 [Burkholderiales bacterium]|nr:hypothetical protein [Burkholderiales bacterium]
MLTDTRSGRCAPALLRGRTLVLLLLLSLGLLAALRWSGADAGFGGTVLLRPFDERIDGYDPGQALSVMAGMDTLQYRAYLRYRLLDLLLPWTLGALLAGSLCALGAPRLARAGWVAAVVDTFENLVLWYLMLQDSASVAVVQAASAFTQLKWVVYGLTLGMLGVVLAQRLLRSATARGARGG